MQGGILHIPGGTELQSHLQLELGVTSFCSANAKLCWRRIVSHQPSQGADTVLPNRLDKGDRGPPCRVWLCAYAANEQGDPSGGRMLAGINRGSNPDAVIPLHLKDVKHCLKESTFVKDLC